MKNLTLEIPDDLLDSLRVPPEDQESYLLKELAVRLYQKGSLSFGKARELCRMTKWEFHELLGKEKIPRHYDVDDLDADLATLEKMD